MKLIPPITFRTNTIRVPESRVVRLPWRYAHEFASMPIDWRIIEVPGESTFIDYPTLDPASERWIGRSGERFAVEALLDDDDRAWE